ncbi:MAG TPA: cysteine--tRNA ligase [Spirochaetota bacterium]
MSVLKFYNTLTRRVEEFFPGGVKKDSIEEYPPVTIYSCGPTVYNYAHIGNFRTYVFNDLLRRYLLFRGYKVNHAMNITDVDDKTIAGSLREGVSLRDYTDRYATIFIEDLASLNIQPVEHMPRATESIDAMADIISRLDKKGIVYEQDGSLYFSISKFAEYGKLSRLDTREIKSGARYDADEYRKDDVRDFALWKGVKDGEPSWDIPQGKGRPGWHIECSAMVRKIFRTTIDIHTGGVDLVFPHHENEIAQSEAAYDEKFVRCWIHWEHLLSEGTKMSKSLGNFYTLRDLIENGYSPRSIRALLLSAHYRKQLNFTLEGVKASEQAMEKIDNFIARLSGLPESVEKNAEIEPVCNHFITQFTECMDEDLNISGATGKLFEFIREVNALIDAGMVTEESGEKILNTLRRVDSVFGFVFFPVSGNNNVDAGRIERLIEERKSAKAQRNFAAADKIRDDLLAEGIILEDGKEGTRWKIKK